MPRPMRKIIQGVTYHCYTRCHGKRDLLRSSYGRRFFIEAVNMCQEKYRFDLVAAEIVSNHIHLVIKTVEDEETISRIMQYIKARIGEKYNRSRGESGPFWNERFGSTIIEESDDPEQYLLWLLWYIGYNPVRKGQSPDPRKNSIGFINCYLNREHISPVEIRLHEYFHKLGDTFDDCVLRFLEYEEMYLKRIALFF